MREITRLEALAKVLDSVVTVPGTKFKIGIDPIIGLIPGVGDALSSFMSGVIIYEAARLGAPKRHLLRMLGNVMLDSIAGAVPVLGDIFDFAFRSNLRNLEILRSIPSEALVPPRDPRAVGRLVAALLIIVLGLVGFAAAYLVRALYLALAS